MTIEMGDDRCTIELLRSIAGPSQSIPSGCTCPLYGNVYTWCTNCCGY